MWSSKCQYAPQNLPLHTWCECFFHVQLKFFYLQWQFSHWWSFLFGRFRAMISPNSWNISKMSSTQRVQNSKIPCDEFADLVRRNTGSFNINKCVPLRMAQWMPPTKIFGEYIVSLASAGTWHKNGACQIVVNVSPCYALIMMILYSFTFFYSIEPSFCVGVRALTAACEGTQWRGTDRNTTRLCHIKHSAACDQAACSLPLSSTDWNYTHRRAECMTTNVIV